MLLSFLTSAICKSTLLKLIAAKGTIVMSYVQRVLQPGEQVRHIVIHWIVYWLVAVALLAVVAYWLGVCGSWRDFGGIRHTPSRSLHCSPDPAMVSLWVTEIAVITDGSSTRRSHQRETNEMNMDKVGSVQIVNQSSGACSTMAT
jgi:hypothetical protein